jgi:hypothetical protein
MKTKKCGDCIHADVCALNEYLPEFSRESSAVGCLAFTDNCNFVEVVRCKDCKHFIQGEPYDPCECMKWKVKWGAVYTTPDGYCHKGERKDK